jgi:hypothetical protein
MVVKMVSLSAVAMVGHLVYWRVVSKAYWKVVATVALLEFVKVGMMVGSLALRSVEQLVALLALMWVPLMAVWLET